MPELIPILTEEEIREKIRLLAQKISQDYQNRNLVVIGVLKGAFIFAADLVRQLTIPIEIDFIRLSSYGACDSSSGTVIRQGDISADIKGKDLLIVEDIIDTGLTMAELSEHLRSFEPKSIRICTFINKLERRRIDCGVDYAVHTVDTGFIVGYGLDYAEKYRNLPAIYHLKL